MSTPEMPKQENITAPETREVAMVLAEEMCQRLGLESEYREMFATYLSNPSTQVEFLRDFVLQKDIEHRIAEKEKRLENLIGGDKVAAMRGKYLFLAKESF